MNNTNQTFFGNRGLDASASDAYFKPTGRPQRVTITGVTVHAPGTTKKLPEKLGGKELKLFATLDLEKHGAPLVWEISSKRAIDALNGALAPDQVLPVDVLVSTAGERVDTTYRIQLAPAELPGAKKGWKGACDAPACVLETGHAGQHKTAKTAIASAAAAADGNASLDA